MCHWIGPAGVASFSSLLNKADRQLAIRVLCGVCDDRLGRPILVVRPVALPLRIAAGNMLPHHRDPEVRHTLRSSQPLNSSLTNTKRRVPPDAYREAAGRIIAALRDQYAGEVVLPEEPTAVLATKSARPDETPRQLIGQPAAPGLESGKVRCIRSSEDLGRFQAGEVLVCDAIQPMITHLVPLAAAIVERRGGMLIHGAIIARELGIPCVNGIADVVDYLNDGDVVTVDGFLGIVTVGPPEFEAELSVAT